MQPPGENPREATDVSTHLSLSLSLSHSLSLSLSLSSLFSLSLSLLSLSLSISLSLSLQCLHNFHRSNQQGPDLAFQVALRSDAVKRLKHCIVGAGEHSSAIAAVGEAVGVSSQVGSFC